MIGDYVVVAVVFGIVVTYVVILHRYWLRDVFENEFQKSTPDMIRDMRDNLTPRSHQLLQPCQSPQTPEYCEDVSSVGVIEDKHHATL